MREEFLLDPDIVFLNHGSFGACPKRVLDVCARWQRETERNPVDLLARRSAALLMDSRRRLADYLGARAEDLVFSSNATTGVNTVARSLDLRPGDEVLATGHEYGACDAAWERVCADAGAAYVRRDVPLPYQGAKAFADHLLAGLNDRTRLVFMSHIASPTALVFPVETVCRRAKEAGVGVMIDGAHAPGQIPLRLDDLAADYYAGNCHKWMLAPKGTAFLHVAPALRSKVHGLVVSWGYTDEVEAHAGYTGEGPLDRRLQWQGTRDLSGFLSVPAAIDFMAANDWDSHRERCHRLAVETMHRGCESTGLPPIGRDEDFAQMVPIPLPESAPADVGRLLFERYRIEVPITSCSGRRFVRASFNAYNTRKDADALLSAIEQLFR